MRERVEYQGWLPKTPAQAEEQQVIRDILRRHGGARHFGAGSYIARGAKVFASHFAIGDDSYIAAGAIVRGNVEIGNGCWIGANAVILDGVKLGAHSIVAAGAVVTAGFPEYSIMGGNPARLLRSRLADPETK